MTTKFIASITLGTLLVSSVSCSKKIVNTTEPRGFATAVDSASYAFGVLQGNSFAQYLSNVPGDSLSKQLILDGFSAAFMDKEVRIGKDAAQTFFQNYIQDIQQREMNELKESNEAALEENKVKEGVSTTESGLQWRVLRQGDGTKPTVQDTVVVHYTGRLISGKEFDSSYKRNQPATFSLLQVIPGWTEGICLMNKGAKYEFYIPSALGYGERGAGGEIPPYATLIFEVELLDIKPYIEPAPEVLPAKPEPVRTKGKNNKKRNK